MLMAAAIIDRTRRTDTWKERGRVGHGGLAWRSQAEGFLYETSGEGETMYATQRVREKRERVERKRKESVFVGNRPCGIVRESVRYSKKGERIN